MSDGRIFIGSAHRIGNHVWEVLAVEEPEDPIEEVVVLRPVQATPHTGGTFRMPGYLFRPAAVQVRPAIVVAAELVP